VIKTATSTRIAGIGSMLLSLNFLIAISTSFFFIRQTIIFLPVILILSIVSILLVLGGMEGLAEHYKDAKIYKRVLIGALFGIIGFILLLIIPIIFGIAHIFILLMAMSFRKSFYTLADSSNKHLFRTAGKMLQLGIIFAFACLIGNVLFFTLLNAAVFILILLILLNSSCLFLMGIAFSVSAKAFFSLNTNPNTPTYAVTPNALLNENTKSTQETQIT
jgi:uncharacterized membrane protein